MGYIYLACAIVAEVIATSALKTTDNFSRVVPSLIVVAGYGAAFYLLTLVLKYFTLGITYALWSGLGIVSIAFIDALFFKQMPDVPGVIGIVLIVSGVVVINLFSKSIGQ